MPTTYKRKEKKRKEKKRKAFYKILSNDKSLPSAKTSIAIL
jgi:hypothetical protein